MIERCEHCGSVLGWMYWTKGGNKYCSLTCETVNNWDWDKYKEDEKEEGA